MDTRINKIKTISKFSILDFLKSGNNKDYINLSNLFWGRIFDKLVLEDFLNNKYLPYKEGKTTQNEYIYLKNESIFILDNINTIKNRIDFSKMTTVPLIQDVFFSFRIFTKILDYYNDYYNDSNIQIELSAGLLFLHDLTCGDDYFKILKDIEDNEFVKDVLIPIFGNVFSIGLDNNVFKIEVFWPTELIIAGIVSNILKKKNNNVKIIIDFSGANEQFDFTQWITFLKEEKRFYNIFDFFIFNNDFGKSFNDIVSYIDGNRTTVENVLYKKNDEVLFFDKKSFLNEEYLNMFMDTNFNKQNIFYLLGERNLFARFLPYKCYWNKCSFCAINFHNQFDYNNDFSYDFFIDKWIEFIVKNKVDVISFQDEAILPKVIIEFAKKIRKKKLNFKFHFRTRFDNLYTLENCKILYEGGARFCGIGLESAVDRVNEGIGNKGTGGLSLDDKLKQIKSFDEAGISFHNYAIMGFPGESNKESAITYNFLKSNINKSNFITCTPNIFLLMKGPKIFSNKEKYGIIIDKVDIDNPFNLSFGFKYKGKKRNLKILNLLVRDLHRKQFTPWLEVDSYIDIQGFWEYIDRSYMFYILKRMNKTNPFHSYNNTNKEILLEGEELKLSSYYKISNYIHFLDFNDNMYVYDWVSCEEIHINSDYKKLLLHYDKNLTLIENLEKIGIIYTIIVGKFIDSLLKAKIFVQL